LAAFAFVAFWGSGCEGTDVGNPPSVPDDAQASLQILATTSSGITVGPINLGGLWIDAASLGVKDIAFVAPSGKVQGASLAAPMAFEPLTGRTSQPDFELALGSGPYSSMRLDLAPLESVPDGFSERLALGSVVVEGRRPDGVPFVVLADTFGPLWLNASATSFQVRSGGQRLFVAFAVDTWFDAEDFDEFGEESELIIDETTGQEFLEVFGAVLAESLTLYRDTNGNGTLEVGVDEVLARGSSSGQGPEVEGGSLGAAEAQGQD
jgi:hypothetical protein